MTECYGWTGCIGEFNLRVGFVEWLFKSVNGLLFQATSSGSKHWLFMQKEKAQSPIWSGSFTYWPERLARVFDQLLGLHSLSMKYVRFGLP